MATTLDCTTAPPAPQAPKRKSGLLTFPQARARLVRTLVERYDREAIIYRLILVGYIAPIDPTASKRSLAYKLAYQILPAGPDRAGKAVR